MIKEEKKIILTGITPSGTLHLGNYIGAIQPTINLAKEKNTETYCLIADCHSLIKLSDAKCRKQYIKEIAAMWMSLEEQSNKLIICKQSDIPEIAELNWIINTVTPKGLINRSHAYKNIVDVNDKNGKGNNNKPITMGLFNYPMLMAADIISFDADIIPTGKDQLQHIEITCNIINKLNSIYNTLIKYPKASKNNIQTIIGLDGKKMSKSYKNTIPLFTTEQKLLNAIMKINTNSQKPNEAKCTKNCIIFNLFKHFSSKEEVLKLSEQYEEGISWKCAKQLLFKKIQETFTEKRQTYLQFLSDEHAITQRLTLDAQKAREISKKVLKKVKEKVGI